MEYQFINCDSIIKKITKEDSLFHGEYCVEPYQNCAFGCHYCDSSFEKTIYVKKNIKEILEKELETIPKGRVIIGSVNDPYQDIEKTFKLTRAILEILQDHSFPCHILTKSPLILRDIPLLSLLDSWVTISITSLHNQVIRIFEPEAPAPSARLQTVYDLRSHGLKAGVALIPILPYIVETEIASIVEAAACAKAQYLLHKHLELKGDQERHFRNLIKIHYPHLLPKYDLLYENAFQPEEHYLQEIHTMLEYYCKKFDIAEQIIP
ncbi:MAG: radical SAM protein [Candidatus Thermoplasmatota archaeon]|nr:radical SAM protein [Candidatus Thermoplasmatota archaeon]